jgi:hypothetical protein
VAVHRSDGRPQQERPNGDEHERIGIPKRERTTADFAEQEQNAKHGNNRWPHQGSDLAARALALLLVAHRYGFLLTFNFFR